MSALGKKKFPNPVKFLLHFVPALVYKAKPRASALECASTAGGRNSPVLSGTVTMKLMASPAAVLQGIEDLFLFTYPYMGSPKLVGGF